METAITRIEASREIWDSNPPPVVNWVDSTHPQSQNVPLLVISRFELFILRL
jgi:hypothetical protein